MYDKGSEKPIGCMGSKSDKRNQQPDFQNGAIVQVKKHIYMYKEKKIHILTEVMKQNKLL